MSTLSINNNSGRGSSNPALTKPKRPLSSYNLFYRFKRFKILESHDKGDHSSETIKQLITAIPGLEAYPFLSTTDLGEGQLEGITLTDEMKEIRRNEIRTTLKDSLSPKTTRRTHRKPQGDMAFAEMTKLMCVPLGKVLMIIHVRCLRNCPRSQGVSI